MPTFGKTDAGSGSGSSNANKTVASIARPSSSGKVIAGHAYIWASAAGMAANMAIYADTAGKPAALLALSDPVTLGTTPGTLVDFTFSGANQIDVTADVDYHVAITWNKPNVSPGISWGRDGTSGVARQSNTYAPDPWSASGSLSGPIAAWIEYAEPPPSALIETLVDDFSTDTGLWPDSYGTYSRVDGRARVACARSGSTELYSGFSSSPIYTIIGSSVIVEVPTLPVAGGGGWAYAQFWFGPNNSGYYLAIDYEAGSNTLLLMDAVDSWDNNATEVAYNATNHRWWRMRESSGTIYWEASPNGLVWTTLRSSPTPSWALDGQCRLGLEASRNSGTNDFAEYDNVNSAPAVPTGPPPWRFFITYM